ncbi:Histone deacetylase superfamily [Lasallia pustulata]|uniref:Histone deacetylase superfamily n=1 Tax=Lasallia pustulata TaxID=136370 RepID=A0A1W5DCR6_9LECA|nr:Histone deacetylase superfamily [Lasallia pustulata]
MPPKLPLPTQEEEPHQARPPTAATVARDYFQKELEMCHTSAESTVDAPKTVVILHDACYGHRFSRPRTSKANLNTIVERPERIHAGILGISTAYVRLGGRHTEAKHAPHPKKDPRSVQTLPFRIQKTSRSASLTSQAVINVHGAKWMEELRVMCESAETKLALNGKELTRPVGQLGAKEEAEKPKLHEGDLYLCSESLNALQGALGGVLEAVDAVFAEAGPQRAFVCIRPPGHHCSASYPSGFCWLNNVHVGIAHASAMYGLTHAAIIDFDLHHGDGSQAITWDHNAKIASMPKNTPASKKTSIGYFSLHDINSYPCEYGDEDKVRNASLCLENAHGQSIWNVHLQPWKSDSEFWDLYEKRYSVLITKTRDYLQVHTERLRASPNHPRPKAAIFLSAGFDASEWESSGMQRHKVNVPTDFYARFTRDVVHLAEEAGLGVDGRVISVLEGGYSDRALTSGVLSHLSGLAETNDVALNGTVSNGLGHEMSGRLGQLDIRDDYSKAAPDHLETVDAAWWAIPKLEELENLVDPPPLAAAPKKLRNVVASSYTSPTQSYTAKIVPSVQGRRSLSGSGWMANSRSTSNSSVRASTSPAPEVDWATAAHELCKLLIPTDRQTRSCRPEDLNAEATRARKDRQSAVGLPSETANVENKRMQLRDRKNKVTNYTVEDENQKPVPRASRRKTIADVGSLDQMTSEEPSIPTGLNFQRPTEQSRRRLSTSSTLGPVTGERVPSITPSTLPIGSNTGSSYATRRRSSSSSTIRPGSSVSNHPEKELPIVRKARAPATTRTVMPKVRPAKQVPPVPRVPPAYSTASTSEDLSNRSFKALSVPKMPLTTHEDSKDKDVDSIASSLKKMSIKLNVPSKEEQEIREAKKKPAARAPRKLTSPRKPKAIATSKAIPKSRPPGVVGVASNIVDPIDKPTIGERTSTSVPEPLVKIETPPPSTATDTLAGYREGPESLPSSFLPPLDPAIPTPTTETTQQAGLGPLPTSFMPPSNPSFPAVATEFQAPNLSPTANPRDNLPSSASLPPPQNEAPLQKPPLPSPPASEPPTFPPPSTPKRTKQDLPIFTSTSTIPFGQSVVISPSILDLLMNPTKEAAVTSPVGDDVDSFPETWTTPFASQPASQTPHDSSGNALTDQSQAQSGVEGDIWDFPDTPQHRMS